MKQLDYPTTFGMFSVDRDGNIVDYKLRAQDGKEKQ